MRTLFSGGQVFDGSGAPPAVADVVVEDSRIVDVGLGLDGDEVVDCAGRGVLPGLFDCHVHLIVGSPDESYNSIDDLHEPFSLQFYRAAVNMRATLAAGITTVRDGCGADLGVKVAQQKGMVAGPRMYISVMQMCQTGGHADYWEASGCCAPGVFTPHPGRPMAVVDGVDAARAKTRELIRAGADVIKIATSGGVFSPRSRPTHAHFRDAEIAVIVEEANAAGISVMSHAYATEGIKSAVRNGVRSIEHGTFLDDEAIAMMVKRGTWLVPTLMQFSPAKPIGDTQYPEHVREKEAVLDANHFESIRRAIAAGVRIAFGTDTGVTPHGRNLDELPLLVECGMTPAQALHAATGSAAELMGLDAELGTLEPGKRADLVIVDGDPLDLADLASRVEQVFQDGVLVHSASHQPTNEGP